MQNSNDDQPVTPSAAILWHCFVSSQGKLVEADSEEREYDWAHLQCDAPGAVEEMQRLGLADEVVGALTENETRPRTMTMDKGLIIYLRGINTNPDADPEDMVSLRIWLTDKRIVTARKRGRRLLSVTDVKNTITAGAGPDTPTELLCLLVERLADRISENVDHIDEELTGFETTIVDQKGRGDRQRLSSLRRQSAAIRRYLAPQRDALDALFRSRLHLSDHQAFALREQSDRMTRYLEELELARERAALLQDEMRNQIAEQQGMRMYVLSLVTAIFLPLSFLTGVFGMNVAGLPGLETPSAFTYLASAMGGLAVIILLAMIWRKWL
ncbi:MAG: zinc transporter ZntB [Aestuariibacter sp.]